MSRLMIQTSNQRQLTENTPQVNIKTKWFSLEQEGFIEAE